MLSQERPFYLWANDQNPLTVSELDDLDEKLSQAQGELMNTMCGIIMPIITDNVPLGTLLCDGSTHERADYPILYDAIDTHYKISSSQFTVPDLRGVFVLGASSSHAQNSSGGSETHTQTVLEMPSHSHTTIPHTHTESLAAPTAITIGAGVPAPSALPAIGVTGASGVTVNSEGGSQAMDIMPPFYALRYVVIAL
jgi:microcystin-dependent protein